MDFFSFHADTWKADVPDNNNLYSSPSFSALSMLEYVTWKLADCSKDLTSVSSLISFYPLFLCLSDSLMVETHDCTWQQFECTQSLCCLFDWAAVTSPGGVGTFCYDKNTFCVSSCLNLPTCVNIIHGWTDLCCLHGGTTVFFTHSPAIKTNHFQNSLKRGNGASASFCKYLLRPSCTLKPVWLMNSRMCFSVQADWIWPAVCHRNSIVERTFIIMLCSVKWQAIEATWEGKLVIHHDS